MRVRSTAVCDAASSKKPSIECFEPSGTARGHTHTQRSRQRVMTWYWLYLNGLRHQRPRRMKALPYECANIRPPVSRRLQQQQLSRSSATTSSTTTTGTVCDVVFFAPSTKHVIASCGKQPDTTQPSPSAQRQPAATSAVSFGESQNTAPPAWSSQWTVRFPGTTTAPR